MKLAFTLILSAICLSLFSHNSDLETADALASRLAPSLSKSIVFKLGNSNRNQDYFRLETLSGKLCITANNANSMAVGLNYFLKNYCHTTISWYVDDQILLPRKLPVVSHPVEIEARVKNRFFLNYCTFGYTMTWWKWRDWEHFIDWMALNGVNLPLAITGQEKVWLNVWKKFGLTEEQIRGFFTGPAYLPWHRMANIDHWEGPLPMSWIDGQAELQKQILERERAFNMKPVLPAFAGHVPKAIAEKYPHAKITSLGEWGNFSQQYQSYFLDSFDTLFAKIQREFLTEQTRLFGTDHVYGTDPFNEVTPPSWKPEYLASVSKNIYDTMASFDKDAQWLQMGWIFYFMQDKWTNERIEAFLQAVPQNKMILLDYFCDNVEVWKRTESFFGQPYIWCYLGNFGGNTTLSGNLKDVDEKIENTFKNGGKNFWGLGATLEGFGNNPVMYEYILEKAWQNTSAEKFSKIYASSRAGKRDANLEAAWQILVNKVYVDYSNVGKGDLTNSKPVLEKSFNWTVDPGIKYSNRDLLQVWQLMLKSNASSDLFKNDLTAVGKQVLGNYFVVLRDQFTAAYRKKNVALMCESATKIEELFADIDRLLASNRNFLVGKWIADAKSMTTVAAEKRYYEKDARKIITVWGEKGRDLNDYANRSIAGLMKDYYARRWKILLEDAIKSVENKMPLDEKAILEKVNELSWNWSEDSNSYPSAPVGNTLEISRKLYEKYALKIKGTTK
jgi:alpha-N-acetylglucosaminidase